MIGDDSLTHSGRMDRWENFRTLDLGDWHKIERRIGARVPTEGLEVTLVPSTDVIDLRDGVRRSGGRGLGHRRRDRGVELAARSRSRPDAGPLRATSTRPSPCATCRPPTMPGVTRYGIEWSRLEDPLRQVVYGVVADARTATA